MTRSPGRWIVAALFAALAVNAWLQVALPLLKRSSDPMMLVALQAMVGASAAAAAFGTLRSARWAPLAAIGYGVLTAAMIVSLRALLNLDDDAARGLWTGAATVLLGTAAVAWWLVRAGRRGR